MDLDHNKLIKRYYTIGEVSQLFEISTSQIRFWETEFEFLKPHKNAKGDRRFTPENIIQLKLIYELVKEKGFTLAGAKQELHKRAKFYKEREQVIQKLIAIKAGLEDLQKDLQNNASEIHSESH